MRAITAAMGRTYAASVPRLPQERALPATVAHHHPRSGPCPRLSRSRK